MTLDRPWIQIRSRGMLEVFDLALLVIQDRPLAILATSMAGILPFVVLNAALIQVWPALDHWWPLFVILEAPLATAPLTILLGGLMFGERPGVRRMVADLIRGLPSLLLYAGLVRGLAIINLLAWLFMADRLAYLNEVILLERSRWTRVLARGRSLGRASIGEIQGRGILQLIFAVVLAVMFWWALPKLAESLVSRWTPMPPGPTWTAFSMQLAAWVAVAFFGVVRFLSYIDQRIKAEGWEVELRLRAAGSAMEEAPTW